MLTPWAIYRGKVLQISAAGNPYLEVVAIGGVGVLLGPCEQVVPATGTPPLAVGDRVLVACVGRRQDDIVIVGVLNAIAPPIT